MIAPSQLDGVRRAIRRFLTIPIDEPVDLVFLASVVANFSPQRQDPVWLVIVAAPGSGKSELLGLLEGWKPTWKIPARLSGGYFLSAKTGSQSALKRIEAQSKRILMLPDMATMLGISRAIRDDIWAQMIGIYDGYYLHETGLNSQPVVYGPHPPEDRLGFLTSATAEFYPWQRHVAQLGSRFLAYYWPSAKAEWHDYKLLVEISRQRAQKSPYRASAKETVQAFLEDAIAGIESLPLVRIRESDVERIAAAVTLVQRTIGTGSTSDDQGTRLSERVQEIIRAIAYMRTQAEPSPEDVRVGLRVVLSQLPVALQRVLTFALLPANLVKGWKLDTLTAFVGGTRKMYGPHVDNMVDLAILRKSGNAGATGYRYKVDSRVVELVETFDPECGIFRHEIESAEFQPVEEIEPVAQDDVEGEIVF